MMRLTILLLFFASFLQAQGNFLNATFKVDSSSFVSDYRFILHGKVNGIGYGGNDAVLGDRLIFMKDDTCGELAVDSILGASTFYLRVRVMSVDSIFDAAPFGVGVLSGKTVNNEFRSSTINASNDLINCIENRFKLEVDNIDITLPDSLVRGRGTVDRFAYWNTDSTLRAAPEIVRSGGNLLLAAPLGLYSWTTGGEPAPVFGLLGMNSSVGRPEYYNGSVYKRLIGGSVTQNYLMRADAAGDAVNAGIIDDGTFLQLDRMTAFREYTTMTLPTMVKNRLVWNNNLNGLYGHNGTRAFYVPESTVPTFANGSVLFANGNNQITQDNTNFFWNNTSKSLMLGKNTFTENGKLLIANAGTAITDYGILLESSPTSAGGGGMVWGQTGRDFVFSSFGENLNTAAAARLRFALLQKSTGTFTNSGIFVMGRDGISMNSDNLEANLLVLRQWNMRSTANGNFIIRSQGGIELFLDDNNNDPANATPFRLRFDLASNTPVIYAQPNVVGLLTESPTRTLDVNGEVRIRDLITDTPTRIVGADADGDLGAITIGTGLSLSSGVLSSTGGAGGADTLYLSNGTRLTNGDTIGIVIDTFRLSGTNLELSLAGDGVGLQTVNLSSINTNIYNTNGTIPASVTRNVTMNTNSRVRFVSANTILSTPTTEFYYDESTGNLTLSAVTKDADIRTVELKDGTSGSEFLQYRATSSDSSLNLPNSEISKWVAQTRNKANTGSVTMHTLINRNAMDGANNYGWYDFLLNQNDAGLVSYFRIYPFETQIRNNAVFTQYGLGNKTATALSKTASIYLLGAATDGAVIERRLDNLFVEGLDSLNAAAIEASLQSRDSVANSASKKCPITIDFAKGGVTVVNDTILIPFAAFKPEGPKASFLVNITVAAWTRNAIQKTGQKAVVKVSEPDSTPHREYVLVPNVTNIPTGTVAKDDVPMSSGSFILFRPDSYAGPTKVWIEIHGQPVSDQTYFEKVEINITRTL